MINKMTETEKVMEMAITECIKETIYEKKRITINIKKLFKKISEGENNFSCNMLSEMKKVILKSNCSFKDNGMLVDYEYFVDIKKREISVRFCIIEDKEAHHLNFNRSTISE